MKTFKQFFREAFTVFPKSSNEISDDNVKQLFDIIKAFPGLAVEDPIAMQPDSFKNIKITRSLQRDNNFISYLSDKLGKKINPIGSITWNGIKIEFGEGSRGGRGVESKGLSFESELENDLNNYNNGSNEFKHTELVNSIIKEFDLESGNFEVISEGGKNKSRPLKFSAEGPHIAYSDISIAATLTDITLSKNDEMIYLSLKHGGTVTFFNSGITKVLPASDIIDGKIQNDYGVALLDTFGIDNELFCRVFNEYDKTNFSEYHKEVTDYDKGKLFNLLSSGIGSGYYMIHGYKNTYKFTNIDEQYNKTASTVTSPITILYGGSTGDGKRIDIAFESATYKFKINIRNKQGKLYPSHIMCDYKPNK